MERRKPLRRRTSLNRGSNTLKRTGTLKRTPMKRATQPQAATPRRTGRRRRERSPQERAAMLAWKIHVTAGAVCAACGADGAEVILDGHHVVKQQVLERLER